MVARELYEILLEIKAEAGPEVAKCLEDLAKRWLDLGVSIEAVNKRMATLAEPDRLRSIKRNIEMLSGPYAKVGLKKLEDIFGQVAESTKEFEKEQKKLAEAEKEVTAATQEQGGALSGLLGILRDVAVVVAGILIRDIIVGGIRKIQEFAGALRDMAVGFVKGTVAVNEQMELYGAQLKALLGGAREAATAISYVARMAIATPFFGIAELEEGVKLLTAFGLNYQRWLPVIVSSSAALGASVQQIANAFGQIAAGATTRGLYYLKLAGINVRDAGIEFDKSGKAIGTTQEILEKLEAYLRDRYADLLPEMAHTWRGSIDAMREMWYQFRWQLGLPSFEIARDKLAQFQDWLSENQDNILAFASVLGEYPARALQRFLDFLGEVTGAIDFQAQDFFQGAVNLMVSFADGLLTALDQYVLPAVVGIAELIASFLLGMSPPTRGPLSRVYEGAIAVMKVYLLALKEGVDFQGLREIAGFIQAALTHAVAIGDLPEEQLAGFVIRAREMIARAIGEIGRIGGVTAPTLAELSAFLGPMFEDVQKYLGLLAQLKAATDAVAAAQQRLAEAQEWVAEAAELVRKAQDRLRRFEIQTAEIPERFTRGRRRELELAIQQAEEERRRRQEAVRMAREQLKAAQEQVRAVKEQISLQRAYLSEMQRIWRLQQEQLKAQEEGTDAFRDTVPELKNIGEEIDKLKEKWRAWFAEVVDPSLRRLEDHWTKLGDFIKGILGIRPEVPREREREKYLWRPTEEWREGARLREAIETIRDNIYKIGDTLVGIKDTFIEIVDIVAPWVVTTEGIASAWNEAWTNIDRIKGALEAIRTFLDEHPEIKRLLGMVTRVSGAVSPFAPPTTFGKMVPGLGINPFTKMFATWADIAIEALGFDTARFLEILDTDISLPFLERMNEWLTKDMKKTVEDGAEEGLYDPLVQAAEDTKKELVGRSIFPDMIDEILQLFRELPGKLYPYLYSLYTTIKIWITLASTTWTLELGKMERSAEDLIRILEDLVSLLERLRDLLRGLGIRMPATSFRHSGGPIFRTGQYQLEAGEYVLSREQAAMAGAGAGMVGGTFNFIHNWPEGIEKLKKREFEKMAEKASFKVVDRLMRGSRRY